MYKRLYCRFYHHHSKRRLSFGSKPQGSNSVAEIMMSFLNLLWLLISFVSFNLVTTDSRIILNLDTTIGLMFAGLIMGFNWYVFSYDNKWKELVGTYSEGGHKYSITRDKIADSIWVISVLLVIGVTIYADIKFGKN